jgi:O-antigen/teichoic acid export membrane protein
MLARVLMIEAVANLMLSIALAPRYGLAGVAWGTAIPLAAVNLLFLPRYMCHLLNVGWREFLFEAYFYPLLAVIPVSLTFWAADSWIHPVTWAGLAATLLLAGVVYGATLFAYYVTVERPLRIPATPATPDPELTR